MNVQTLGITSWETERDIARVLSEDIHFIVVACAGETCSKCEHPLWTHIQSQLARYCPTDGRPYWRLVLAILRITGVTDGAKEEVISEIQDCVR